MQIMSFFRLHKNWAIGWSCLLIFCIAIFTANLSQARVTLKVAIEPSFPPFELLGKDGKLDGFDVDLFKAIAKAADFNIEFKTMQFDGMIPALQSKTIDAALAAMTITAERQKVIDFSRPYFKSGLAIAIKSDNTDITSFDSLKNKNVAVQIGTTGAMEAAKIPGAKIRTFDSAPLVIQELINGNVDAVLNDAAVTLYAIKENNISGIKIIDRLLTEEYYGIPVPKGSPNLKAINAGLATIISDRTYDRIYQKWFNAQAPQLPEQVTFKNSTNSGQSNNIILKALPNLLQGVLVTLYLTAFSVFLGAIGGSLIGILRLSPIVPIQWATRIYIDFFRGTPLLVQIFMIYFGLPALLQEFGITFSLDRLTAAVMALSINSAAYIAEIVRAGIQSIEIGQSEAAQSLGLGTIQTMRHVIFPQALRRMLPPLGNEFITMLKDTSLVAVIGFEELFQQGRLIVANNYRAFEIYGVVALIYLALTILSSRVFSWLEKRMNPVNKAAENKAIATEQ